MSVTVWKYPLRTRGAPQMLDLPQGAQVLTVQLQNGEPMPWVLIPDPAAETQPRQFLITGTGYEMLIDPACLAYINTFQMSVYVFHVFEVKEAPCKP